MENVDVAGAAAVLLTAICFAGYWFLAKSLQLKTWTFRERHSEKSWIHYIAFQRMVGILFLGLIPAAIIFGAYNFSAKEVGINLNALGQSSAFIAVMVALILPMNYLVSRNPEHQRVYPEMRLSTWTSRAQLINIITWTGYLAAYEFLFRGILLFLCHSAFGFWPAIAINVALYTTTHIPKGAGETIGTVPYGLLLCYATLSTGGIWVAFVTHLTLALSSDLFSIHHNPEMKMTR